MEDAEKSFALGDELVSLLGKFSAGLLSVLKILVDLLLFFEFIGEILSAGHDLVIDTDDMLL